MNDHKGKPRISLLPIETLEEVAHVLEAGNGKDGRTAFDWRAEPRYTYLGYWDKAMRHLFEWRQLADLDPETARRTLAHAIADLAILDDLTAHGIGTDDRRPPQNPEPDLVIKRPDRAKPGPSAALSAQCEKLD